MGRYAFFNTGYEYKFTFGIQSSSDMLEFGGTQVGFVDGYFIHSWVQEDAPAILEKLRKLEEDLGLPEFAFERYLPDTNGTSKVLLDLWEYLDTEMEEHCLYQLGCIIYHQLLYKTLLRVDFEG